MPLPPLGIFDKAAGAATSYESIATVTVGSGGSSSISFSSIPSTFAHLQIRLISRNDRSNAYADNVAVRFNSDSGSNYSWHSLYGTGSAVGTENGTSTSYAIAGFLSSTSISGASAFAGGFIDILDYADTNKYKTIRSLGGHDDNTRGYVSLSSGNWRSTSAVSSITLLPANASNFSQYSTFALYGIKSA